MHMERERRNNGGIEDYYHVDRSLLMESSSNFFPISSSSSLLPPPSSPLLPGGVSVGVGVGGGGASYIEHPVSKFDTLAGVAIKYGVEVADVKRMNGLVTDLQMFALKSLHIPLPGRHPPSPIIANGFESQGPSISEQTPPNRRHSDLFDSFQSLKLKSSPQRKVSSAMSSLQGYYGLKPPDHKAVPEGCEMSVYRKGGAHYLEDTSFGKTSPLSNPPLTHHRKSKSVADRLWKENGDIGNELLVTEAREAESDKWLENMLRRNHKSEADFSSPTPVKLLKDESSSNGGFSGIAGTGLALRPKAASRTVSAADSEAGRPNPNPIGLMDSLVADNSSVVRKSSSTSNLQDSDNNGSSSSIWPTSKWSLKPDLQALSTAAITRPIFDGLPKPISGRKNKTAVD